MKGWRKVAVSEFRRVWREMNIFSQKKCCLFITLEKNVEEENAVEVHKKNGLNYLLGAVPLLLFFFVFGMTTGEARAEDKKSQKKVVTLEAVTVTAQKQEESAQETPVSLTILDEMDLQDNMVDSIADLVDFVPNMATFNAMTLGENVVTMRGITATSATRNTAIGMYIDGVPALSSLGYTSGLLDVERVEVLRGPQGTLYGKSTQAGVVSIVTKQPSNEFEAKIITEGAKQLATKAGDQFNGNIGGSVSGPIVKDNLFFTASGKLEHKDGFVENTFTNEPEDEFQNAFFDGKLRWTPTEKLDITGYFSVQNLEQEGTNANLAGGTNREVQSDLRGHQTTNVDMEALNVSYAFNDDLKLTSITARRRMELYGDLDMDLMPMLLAHSDKTTGKTEVYSQEFRLNGKSKSWDWLVGVYGDSDTLEYHAKVDSMFPAYCNVLDTKRDGTSFAGYAHVGYNITTDWKILGGARYEYQNYDFQSSTLSDDLSKDWTNFSPKIGMQYQVLPESMLYATVSQGYRPGGFNERAYNTDYSTYDPETMWSYEVGAKNTFLGNKLLLNVSLFYMDISDKQVEENVDLTTYYITNGARATSMGAEVDLTAILAPGLRVNGGFGYTHAEFDSFSDASGDYKGNKLPYAPEYTYNLGFQYRLDGGWYLGADFMGYGKTYFDKNNTSYRDGYALVNCKVGYETEHFDFYLYGKNIFDTEYDIENWNGFDLYSEPGEFGIQVVARF
jgi:iron complex outermembrane receptor protein